MKKKSLFERLCRYPHLSDAWNKVKSAGSSGGIDQVTVHQFEKTAHNELDRLCADLKAGSYVPQPYKAGSIPKDRHTSREIGLLTVRDKIVQQGMQMLLYPLIDKQLMPCCYAYRKGKGAVKAVKRVRHAINAEKSTLIVSCDIRGYFDHIPHQPLFDILKNIIIDERMLDLIELSVRMGSVKRGNRWKDASLGIPQGGVISPLLANLYLTPLDKAVLNTGCSYVRYADDFVALARNDAMAKQGLESIKTVVESLQLCLKEEGTIEEIDKGFVFLGVKFISNEISICDKKQERMKEKLTLTMRQPTLSRVNHITQIIKGYKAFYCQLFDEESLMFADEHLLKLLSERISKENISTFKVAEQVFGSLPYLTSSYQKAGMDNLRSILNKQRSMGSTGMQSRSKQPRSVAQKVAQRKREYQKLENEGKELIINSFGSYLGVSKNKVSVRGKVEKQQLVPIDNLSHITILSNGVSFSSDFIFQCAINHIPVSFFSRTGEHYATIYSPTTTDNQLWLNQLESTTSETGNYIAKTLVEAKIKNQLNLLKYFHKYHKKGDPGFAELYSLKIKQLTKLSKTEPVSLTEKSNKEYRQYLMGQEAQAALIYWDLIRELINDDIEFSGRVRQGARDLVNSLLNYGYAILYARIWEAVLAARLNPYLSFLHSPNSSKPTLIFDLVENFRQQAVDRVVITLVQKKEKLEICGGRLTDDTRAKLTKNIYERLHRYEVFRGERRRFSDIIRIEVSALAEYIRGGTKSFKPYIAKW